MRTRWHLMKMQAAHERGQTRDIDVGVLIYPTDRDPSLRRTRRELEGPFFTDYFPIHFPVYVMEYASAPEWGGVEWGDYNAIPTPAIALFVLFNR